MACYLKRIRFAYLGTSSTTRTWKAGKATDKVMKNKHKKKEKEKAPTTGPSGDTHRTIWRLKLKTPFVTTGPSSRRRRTIRRAGQVPEHSDSPLDALG